MENGELYGKVFYACFVNGDEREEQYPFAFLNEYELVETGAVETHLGGEGNLKLYYVTVYIEGRREAGKVGGYGKWYRMEFGERGTYYCEVEDYSAGVEEMFTTVSYMCNTTPISREESEYLNERFKVYPDGEHIFYADAKMQEKEGSFGTLPIGTPIDSIAVWHCGAPYYLCAEFYDANQLPIGLFDMGYHGFVYANYSDQNMPPGGNWGSRVPITVIISHWHDDHVKGLVSMAESHNAGYPRTYLYFFQNIDLHVPDTFQPPSFDLVVNTIRSVGGTVTIYDDQNPMNAQSPAFGYGLAEFNHPLTGAYNHHPHLHGMYVRCQTVGGRSVLMVGDTVYRGIQNVGAGGNQQPHQGDLASAYDVLIACHHGGDYQVSIAGNNYPQNKAAADYIPIPSTNPVAIYSANGNGITGSHPSPVYIADYRSKGWRAGVITNANFSTYGNIPGYININGQSGLVEIT